MLHIFRRILSSFSATTVGPQPITSILAKTSRVIVVSLLVLLTATMLMAQAPGSGKVNTFSGKHTVPLTGTGR